MASTLLTIAPIALLTASLCVGCESSTPTSQRPAICGAYKGLYFGAETSAVRLELARSDAFECWDDECGGAYSLLGPRVRIIVPEFEAGLMKSVYVFSEKISACCFDILVRAEWDFTVSQLSKEFGEPEIVSGFPAEAPASSWFVTHRWSLHGKAIELALHRDDEPAEGPTFSVAADIRANHCFATGQQGTRGAQQAGPN